MYGPPPDCKKRLVSAKISLRKCIRRLLLGNLYMRRFVLGWKRLGHEQRLKAHIVNYADDLVICCRTGAEKALATMRTMMTKLKLMVNESKTRVCKLPEEKLDSLSYMLGRCYSMKRGRAYLGTVPSKQRVQRICRAISDETGRNTAWIDPKTMVAKLNRMLIGWANYFCLGPVSRAYSAVDIHARRRLRRWLCDKHKEPRPTFKRFPEAALHSVFGSVNLPRRTASLPWAKVMSLFREPDAGKLPVRFDERGQETELRQTGLRRSGESQFQ
jgi:RNA-directed DNA polymerase